MRVCIAQLMALHFYRTILVMSRILIINPNTTSSITALLKAHAQHSAAPGIEVDAVTARFGAPYIACEVSYAIAAHAALDAWARAAHPVDTKPDAVLIGCFGDPGLLAMRDASSAPVTGLAEASFLAAAQLGRFAIVTGGPRWKPMLERLAAMLGFGTQLAGITTVAPSGAELAANPTAATDLLAKACQQAAQDFKADAIILGGAGLAGMAAQVQAKVGVPVIDSVVAGVSHAAQLATQTGRQATQNSGRLEEVSPWLGLGSSADLG